MDTMITADARRNSCTFMEETVNCESADIAARRRRKEIRRFKLIANSSFCEPSNKRSRSSSGYPRLSHGKDQARLAPCSPNCNLALRPSNHAAYNDDGKFDPSGGRQTLDCPSGQDARRSLASCSSPPWERTSPGNIMHSSSSGDDDSASSGSGSTSSGSSISSDSTGTSLESNEAEASSTITWTSDVARPCGLSQSQSQVEVSATIVHAQETPHDRPKSSTDRDNMDLKDITGTPTTSGSKNSMEDGHCPPHGLVSVCGRRREMEDAVAAVPAFLSVPCHANGCRCRHNGETRSPFHFFGVYDGHGGSQAAVFCADRLHHALAEEMNAVLNIGSSNTGSSHIGWDLQWRKAMAACFLRMDAEVGGVCWKGGLCDKDNEISKCCVEPIAPETVGSTAVVAVVGSCQIIVGNCGDSRAVLSRGGRAIALSNDHKPEREDEMARVEAAGGRVISWNGYRVLGVLAMSRAIGDRYLKPYVIAEPEVTCTLRSEEDECLILASDGLWDVLSNDVVCDIARKCLTGRGNCDQGFNLHMASLDDEMEESPAAVAAALLTKLALARGSSDNISVVVVNLMARASG